MIIQWSAFSWEAFSTLVTGFLAVGAAFFVGRRQLKLQERQTLLIENDLKIQLLERRMDCVAQMREIYWAWSANSKLSDEEISKFYKLVEDAQILFPVETNKKLDETLHSSFWSKHYLNRAYMYREDGEEEAAGRLVDKSFDEAEKLLKLMPEVLKEIVDHTRVDAWQ